jgi:hypothetical protein
VALGGGGKAATGQKSVHGKNAAVICQLLASENFLLLIKDVAFLILKSVNKIKIWSSFDQVMTSLAKYDF